MAENETPSTKKYLVRAIRSFQMPQHRRAGIVITPGPTPIEVELTKEQYASIKADPVLEFVKLKDGIVTAQQSTPKEDGRANEVGPNGAGGSIPTPGGRRYETDETPDEDTPEETDDEKAEREIKEAEAQKVADDAIYAKDFGKTNGTDLVRIAELEGVDLTEADTNAKKREAIQTARDEKAKTQE